MRVRNWQRWQRTKGVTAGLLFVSGIALIGGLDGSTPLPPTAPYGLACGVLSVILIENVIRHDRKINPHRYDQRSYK